jgi:hypothetical protein
MHVIKCAQDTRAPHLALVAVHQRAVLPSRARAIPLVGRAQRDVSRVHHLVPSLAPRPLRLAAAITPFQVGVDAAAGLMGRAALAFKPQAAKVLLLAALLS